MIQELNTEKRMQQGLTLIEVLLVLAVAAGLVAAAYTAYGVARNDALVTDTQTGTIQLTSRIKQVFNASGNYADLTPVLINRAGILPAQFRFDGKDIRDPFGNVVGVSGGQGAFALMFEGMSRDNCISLANGLNVIAHRITLGPRAALADGKALGMQEYRHASGELNPAVLLEECGRSDVRDRKLAVEIR